MTVTRLAPLFQATFPDQLERGVLYISVDYDTTAHLCVCGCGNVVTLALHPTGWQFTYDGRSVSMSPSVGNWSFPCRSHYWIRRGEVHWAPAWSDDDVRLGREATLAARNIAGPSAHDGRSGAGSRRSRRRRRWLRWPWNRPAPS